MEYTFPVMVLSHSSGKGHPQNWERSAKVHFNVIQHLQMIKNKLCCLEDIPCNAV